MRRLPRRLFFLIARKPSSCWSWRLELPDNSHGRNRAGIYFTIFALMYGLGLRVAEATRLCRQDVDLERKVLVIRETKFLKSRLVPFGPKIEARLREYLQREGALGPTTPLFSFAPDRSKPITTSTVTQTFHALWPRLGLKVPAGAAPPRLHCLRHSFAVGTLLRWYRSGINPQQRLWDLSTFMGHVHPASTAVYLTITARIARRSQSALPSLCGAAAKGGGTMNTDFGSLLYSFFEDYLKCQKGLRPSSLKSYRDSAKLFLLFLAEKTGHKVSRLTLADLTCAQVLAFLQSLETHRENQVRTRNQRLAAIRSLFDYLARRVPEMLKEAQNVAAIPTKRTTPAETFFLEQDEMQSLFASLPAKGSAALRDRVLLLFLYNTGARVQEVADLRYKNLELEGQPRVHLHGKGDKWRVCPLWKETVALLKQLLAEHSTNDPERAVFVSLQGLALTRFGIYKIVRRHTRSLLKSDESPRRISPHTFRHTSAVHLLEAGVEVNVIRGWLGHVSLDTTNRYAEINIRMKQAALEACQRHGLLAGRRGTDEMAQNSMKIM
jgi:integrase/recombinase XerD